MWPIVGACNSININDHNSEIISPSRQLRIMYIVLLTKWELRCIIYKNKNPKWSQMPSRLRSLILHTCGCLHVNSMFHTLTHIVLFSSNILLRTNLPIYNSNIRSTSLIQLLISIPHLYMMGRWLGVVSRTNTKITRVQNEMDYMIILREPL